MWFIAYAIFGSVAVDEYTRRQAAGMKVKE